MLLQRPYLTAPEDVLLLLGKLVCCDVRLAKKRMFVQLLGVAPPQVVEEVVREVRSLNVVERHAWLWAGAGWLVVARCCPKTWRDGFIRTRTKQRA
jgi:hypothetical protein